MTAWTRDELDKIANADELRLATIRPDGSLRDPVTIWVVRHGDDLYIRSYLGPSGSWFRRAREIISVVTVTAPDRYAAVAVARAVVSDALKRQAPSSSQPADDRAQHRAEMLER
jgi:hypothetical protein